MTIHVGSNDETKLQKYIIIVLALVPANKNILHMNAIKQILTWCIGIHIFLYYLKTKLCNLFLFSSSNIFMKYTK